VCEYARRSVSRSDPKNFAAINPRVTATCRVHEEIDIHAWRKRLAQGLNPVKDVEADANHAMGRGRHAEAAFRKERQESWLITDKEKAR
jgi:hypothetical protein